MIEIGSKLGTLIRNWLIDSFGVIEKDLVLDYQVIRFARLLTRQQLFLVCFLSRPERCGNQVALVFSNLTRLVCFFSITYRIDGNPVNN